MEKYYLTPQDFEIAEGNGIKKKTVERRVMDFGWDIDRAITEPVNVQHRATGVWAQWEHVANVTYQNFRTRLSRGWSVQDAALTPPGKPRGCTVEREVLDVPYLIARQSVNEVTLHA